MLKLVFVGSAGVGKDAIVSAIKGLPFLELYSSTPGPSYNFHEMPEKNIKLHLETTPGKKKHERYIPFSTNTANILFFVYDITSQQSFDDLIEWIEISSVPENALKVILANKKDLEDEREVAEIDAMNFAKEQGALYFEVSAKDSENIVDCVQKITDKYLGKEEEDSLSLEGDPVLKRKVAKLQNYVGILDSLKNSRPLLKDPAPKIASIVDLFPIGKLPTKEEVSAILEDSKHILLQNRTKLPFSFYTLMSWMRGRTNPLLKDRPCESRTEWKLVKILNAFPEEPIEISESSLESSASQS